MLVGELSLDGTVRSVRGPLPIAVAARANKIKKLLVPEAKANEAAVVSGIDVYPVKSMIQVINLFNTGNGITPVKLDPQEILQKVQHPANGTHGLAWWHPRLPEPNSTRPWMTTQGHCIFARRRMACTCEWRC